MSSPLYVVPVRDLERSDLHRSWEIPTSWLAHALSETEATAEGAPGQLELYLKMSGREVLVKGTARARVVMPCARTLEPLTIPLEAEMYLLLSPRAPVVPERPERSRPERGRPEHKRGARDDAAGRDRKRTKAPPAEVERELSAEEAGRDHYEGDTVVLDEFVREHLLLELPLFPVKSDLPSEPVQATGSLPEPAASDEPAPLDPRLAPLAAIRSGMKRPGAEEKK